MPNLLLTKFTPRSIKPNRIITVIGKRGSGKTVLLRDLMYQLRDRFDLVLALTGTEASADAFRQYIPECFIFDVEIKKIAKAVEIAKVLRKHGNTREILIIMDDFMDKKSILDADVFRDIGYNGRNFNFTLIISLQYCMEMKPFLRSQIDYCFVFFEPNRSNRKKLWEYFFGIFDDFDSFTHTLSKCTRNFECMVLDTTQNTGDVQDQLHYYKSDINVSQLQFRTCKSIFWYLNDLYKNSSYSNVNNLFDDLISRTEDNKKTNTKDSRQDRLVIQKI